MIADTHARVEHAPMIAIHVARVNRTPMPDNHTSTPMNAFTRPDDRATTQLAAHLIQLVHTSTPMNAFTPPDDRATTQLAAHLSQLVALANRPR